MTIARTIITAALLALISIPASGHSWEWNPNKRPPVSASEALKRAEILLGEDAAQSFCFDLYLRGNDKFDGKEYIWDLYFACKDGSTIEVTIWNACEEGHLSRSEPRTYQAAEKECRTGLEDIASRLDTVLKTEGYAQRVKLNDNKLTLRLQPRTYHIHPMTESGEYSKDLVEVIGPKNDGLIIEASIISESEAGAFNRLRLYGAPYYYWSEGSCLFPLPEKGKYIKAKMQYGLAMQNSASPFCEDTSRGILTKLTETFGNSIGYFDQPGKTIDRPPIAISDALQRAETQLGEDANKWYCIAVKLKGNEAQGDKPAVWDLTYATADGSKKLVSIREDGSVDAKKLNGPFEWTKEPKRRRTSLKEIATHLNAALKSEGYEECATVTDGKLVLRSRTRTYRIHPKTESEDYSEEIAEVVGPKTDGIVIKAREVILFDHEVNMSAIFSNYGPYWSDNQGYYLLTPGDKPLKKVAHDGLWGKTTSEQHRFVHVELNLGNDISVALYLKLQRAFGIHYSH